MIKAGQVILNGSVCTKPSADVSEADIIELSCEPLKYAGRGGLKLEKAIEAFGFDVTGLTCLDIGASTGGFTDCLLQNGAEKVYALDVGHGQLAPKFLADERVVNLEKTDIRSVNADTFSGALDFICTDVSFISLRLVLPKIYELLGNGRFAAALIKPQFEAGRANIGKNGIVKDEGIRKAVVEEIKAFAQGLGFIVIGVCESPVKGGSGNTEYLLALSKQ